MLQELPREILILISECLDQIQPRSVIDLACANKNFFSICAALLLGTLKFDVSDNGEHLAEEQLAEDVLHYSELLQRTNGFWMVRRLIIVSSERKKVFIGPLPFKPQWQRPRMSIVDYRGHENDILHRYAGQPGSLEYKDTAHQKNRLWRPLADFILRLPLLKSIFYSGYYQFPPCLFDSLQQHPNQSQCRLYITRFALWSLEAHGTTDPYEFALLSSSYLHGIGTLSPSASQQSHLYLAQALRHLVSGLTPCLKKLALMRPFVHRPNPPPKPSPWIGFTSVPQPKHHRCGSLETFTTRGGSNEVYRRAAVEKWSQDTDVSVLKTLQIDPKLKLDAIEYMTENCRFLSLVHLSIRLQSIRNRPELSSLYYSAASLLLLNIPALSTLRLHGWHHKMTTDTILIHHGTRLQELVLLPALGETIPLETLHLISENCPFLEEIITRIKQPGSHAEKVLKYKASELKRLVLELAQNQALVLSSA